LILGLVALLTVDRWGQRLVTMQALSDYLVELELKAVAKIFVATMQILTAFTKVLNVEMPFDFQSLLQLLAIFRFDLVSIAGLGCMMEESYANSLAANFGLVVTMVLMSMGVAILERYKEPSESKLQTFFNAADTDGTGLTLDEIVAVIHQVDDTVKPGRVQKMFMEADADSSERLSFDEFYAAYTQKSGLGDLLRQAQRKRSFNDSLGRMFLLVFLIYPGLTSKIFDIFLCRDLGPGTTPQRVLHADYGVDCDDTLVVRNGMGVLLVGIWPIGVPAALVISMLQYRKAIVAQDEAALHMFQFVIADYKPECWYWEVVELTRKLLLSGLIVVVGRGTVAQAAAAAMISCFFLALSAKVEPFKSHALNVIKIVSEVQLFVVLLVCVILQTRGNTLDAESITVEDYGVIQTVATLAISPITMGFVVYNVRKMQMDLKRASTDDAKATTDFEGDTVMKMDNPLDMDDDGDALQEAEDENPMSECH
jgi:Ca2+-binding EF-hand superfamily protein